MKRYLWLVCLYLGLILVFFVQAQSPAGPSGPVQVEFQYQQF